MNQNTTPLKTKRYAKRIIINMSFRLSEKHKRLKPKSHTRNTVKPPNHLPMGGNANPWPAPSRGGGCGGVVGGQGRISGYVGSHPPQRMHPHPMQYQQHHPAHQQQHEDFGDGVHYVQHSGQTHSGPPAAPSMMQPQRAGPSLARRSGPPAGMVQQQQQQQPGGRGMAQRPGGSMVQRGGGRGRGGSAGPSGGYRATPYSRPQQPMDGGSYY